MQQKRKTFTVILEIILYSRPVRGCINVGCVAGWGLCCLGFVTLVLLLANSNLKVCGRSGSNLTPCNINITNLLHCIFYSLSTTGHFILVSVIHCFLCFCKMLQNPCQKNLYLIIKSSFFQSKV